MYSSTLSLFSAPKGAGDRVTTGKETRYPLYKRLSEPQNRSERFLKISPTPGFDPRTVQSVAIRYTHSHLPHAKYVTLRRV